MKKQIEWRKVTYPGVRPNMYMISEDGDLLNMISNRTLSKAYDKDGYVKYSLVGAFTSQKVKVFAHRLVAHQFVPNPYGYPVVDHLDGVKDHNHYTNLELVTIRENTLRAERMGLRNVQGANNGMATHTEEEVRAICEMYQSGLGLKDVFKILENNPNASSDDNHALYVFLYKLKTKEIWQNITSEYNYSTVAKGNTKWKAPVPQSSNFVYSEELIREICRRLENNEKYLDILEALCGTKDYTDPSAKKIYDLIVSIYHRESWRSISDQYNFEGINPSQRETTLDVNICNMYDKGYTVKHICRSMGVMHEKDDPVFWKSIENMVRRYRKMKKLQANESVITSMDSEE